MVSIPSNEDYYNQFTFNQVTNIMMNNNNNSNNGQNNSMSNHHPNQYTYHTLQSPQIQNNQNNYSNQAMSANNGNNNNINNSNMNSYMSMGGPQPIVYNNSKITSRTPSYNSSSLQCNGSSSSLASSPSSSSLLSSSATSLNSVVPSSNAQNAVSSSTNESFDYDNASSSGTPSAPPANDPAEMARQKQMRGLTLTPEELQLLAKDRQRKDNHNMSR